MSHDSLDHEFPDLAGLPVSRRRLMQLMAASLTLAGVTGCGRRPAEEIVPYVQMPEGVVPGRPLFFATALTLGGYAQGVLVESHTGRPTKVEGNPLHPASLGATDPFAQAAVLGLYDPDRSQTVTFEGRVTTWERFLTAMAAKRSNFRRNGGIGLRLLTGTVTSPTFGWQWQRLQEIFPEARWHQYDPVNRDAARAGARLAFGEPLDTHYQMDRAKVIVALDGDFLGWHPGRLRYGREFIEGRRVRDGKASMNRLYALESTPTLTGAMADHRLAVTAGRIETAARALARRLGLDVAGSADELPLPEGWLDGLVSDLERHRGESVIIAGEHQSPAVHALAHALNERLGNAGETVLHADPVEVRPVDQNASLKALVREMNGGEVETLLILGGNPVYDAPADLDFADALKNVPLRVHWGLYPDETAGLCQWHVPAAHELESWGDARAYEGTVTIQQPLIAPLYGGRSVHELLAVLIEGQDRPGYEQVRAYWRSRSTGTDFEPFWRSALREGLVPGTAAPLRPFPVVGDLAGRLPPPAAAVPLEIGFRPDPTIWDGRFANNGWLQELPKPLTSLVWSNAALLAPATAERLGLQNHDVVDLIHKERHLEAPVWIMPGHAEDAVTLYLGYGRNSAGRVGSGAGADAYRLRTSRRPWFAGGAMLRRTGRQSRLVSTQHYHGMHGRDLVRRTTLAALGPNGHALEPPHKSLYPDYGYGDGPAWGMAIDLTACIGCNACVVACQAENNIPVVGEEEVARGHDMHWLRVDRCYEGDVDRPETYFQPVPCMHCENAPCEYVCPVAATVHDSEGLNVQVYNRCIGTRDCSQNCPYKVRRFNWLDYNYGPGEGLEAVLNPDVTVRSRGVMEKCTYCVQRISAARIEAKKENRPIRDGEVVTACQAVCPTRAIVFGDLNDPKSEVNAWKASPLNYVLLAELNTRPRTSYLIRVRNPNPEIAQIFPIVSGPPSLSLPRKGGGDVLLSFAGIGHMYLDDGETGGISEESA